MANPENIGRIVDQYQKTVGALEIMFATARPRTKFEVWRFDKAGSCKYVFKEFSEAGLTGEAKEAIIQHREQKNQEHGGSPCPYHREESGCVLGDLKSPLCISHFDADWEWKKNFGVDARALRPEIELILKSILEGDN